MSDYTIKLYTVVYKKKMIWLVALGNIYGAVQLKCTVLHTCIELALSSST